jgi:hypothetical protein
VRGSDNLLADALSRMPQRDSSSVRDNHLSSIEKDESIAHAYSIICDDESLLECFLHHPFLGDELTFPLDYNVIYAHQQQDAELQQLHQNQPLRYPLINFETLQLICYVKDLNEHWRIAIPTILLILIIKWYHIMLSHVGMTRL